MNEYKNYINGEWLDSSHSIENYNPSDINDLVGHYAVADVSQLELALSAAKDAHRSWSDSSIQARFDTLDQIGTELLSRKDELGYFLSREEGKTLPEGIGEVARAGQIFKFFAGEVLRMGGESLRSVRDGISIQVDRASVGPVGVITPWNFPIAIPAWKIAPALAFGNTVVFKPSELVPGSAWNLAEIISRTSLPNGVFNLAMGEGATVGDTITNSDAISAVSFTGSVATGSKVLDACSRRGAKCQMEMGGKNPLIVTQNADLKVAVDCAVNGAYFSTGQRCTASSRFIVESGIKNQFVEKLTHRLSELYVGNALEKGTDIGPVIDQAQFEKNAKYIELGRREGAELAFGGERLERETNGFFMSPALFVNSTNEMAINQEEIFGPVASVIEVSDFDEALHVSNATQFGLCAGICTSSLLEAKRFQKEIDVGMTMVNLPTAGVDYHVPFGGVKGSSYGPREQGSYAIDFYTTVKTSYLLP